MGRTSIYVLMFGVYIAFVLAVGFFYQKKGMKNLTGVFLAGKKAGWYLVALSFFATGIGAGGTIGLTASTYSMKSIASFWSYGISIASFFVVAALLGRILPGTKNITVPELLEERYDSKTRIAAIPLYLLRFISTLGAQWLAAGAILSFVFPHLSLIQAMVISAIVVTVYTTAGGMSAVMWTDFVQGLVIFFGLWIFAITNIFHMGGLSSMVAQVTEVAPQAFNIFAMKKSLIIGYIIILVPTLLVRQGYLQRIMAARSPEDGYRGTISNGILGLIYIVVPLLLGVMALVQFPHVANTKYVLLDMAGQMSPALTGLILVALAAAVMSSADSFLLSGSSNIVEDIYHRYINPNADNRQLVLVSRISIILLMLLSLGIAVVVPGIIKLIVFGALGLTAGVLVPWLAIFYWPRGTSDGAFWSIVLGGGSAIAWWWAGYFVHTSEFLGVNPIFIGLPLSIVFFFAISLKQKPMYEKALTVAKKHNIKYIEKKVQGVKR